MDLLVLLARILWTIQALEEQGEMEEQEQITDGAAAVPGFLETERRRLML